MIKKYIHSLFIYVKAPIFKVLQFFCHKYPYSIFFYLLLISTQSFSQCPPTTTFTHTDPWKTTLPCFITTNFEDTGNGICGSGDDAARFKTVGRYYQMQIDFIPKEVEFCYDYNTDVGNLLKLEESTNGAAWTTIADPIPQGNDQTLTYSLLSTTRYLRWTQTAFSGSGNNRLDNVTVTESTYKSTFTAMDVGSASWCEGESRDVTVTVTNSGTETWTDASPDVNIGCKWDYMADYDYRVDAGDLAPGASQTYTFTVTAPSGGTEHLTFDVVVEAICWFGGNGAPCGPGNNTSSSVDLTIYTAAPAPTSISGTTSIPCGDETTLTAEGGMVVYYPFSSDVNDASGNGLHLAGAGGTFTGGGIQLTTGSSYTSAVTDVLNTDNYTMVFDMQFTDAPDASWRKIFGYSAGGSDRSPGIWKYPSDMRLHWRHDPANTGLAEAQVYTEDQWYHVVGEKNGGTLTIFIDGVQVDQGAVADPKTAGNAALWFGGAPVLLKEFKIYNSNLAWYTGSCGGTLVGTGQSITVSPAVTTTYYLRTEGCNLSSCVSQVVTVGGCSDITLAANAVAADNLCPSATKVPIQSFSGAITVGDGSLTGLSFTTTGSYVQADIDNYKLWYNTTNDLASATQVGSTLASSGTAGARSFAAFASPTLTNGNTYYFWITVDVAAAATTTNTLACNATVTGDLTYVGTKAGSTSAGGTQTVLGIPAQPSTMNSE